MPTANRQLPKRYTTNDAEADNPIEASAGTDRANARHQWNKPARRNLPTVESCCIFSFLEERRQTVRIGIAGGFGAAASEGIGEGVEVRMNLLNQAQAWASLIIAAAA